MLKIIKTIFYFLFPSKCYLCENKSEKGKICKRCKIFYKQIFKIGKLSDRKFKNTILYASIYKDVSKTMILDLKYKKQKDVVDIYLDLIKNKIKFLKYIKNIKYISYIPTSKKNIKIRSYDQARLIAEKLSSTYNIPLIKLLEKNENKKEIKEQKTLSKEERMHNVKGNFKIYKDIIKKINGNILIVDDVYTTGATAYEVKRILKNKNKYINIFFFVLGYTKLN